MSSLNPEGQEADLSKKELEKTDTGSGAVPSADAASTPNQNDDEQHQQKKPSLTGQLTTATTDRKASLKSQDPVASKEVAQAQGTTERRSSVKSQEPVAPKEVAEVKGTTERKASVKSQVKEVERKEEDELRRLLASAEQRLKACQQELQSEQQVASDESIVVASLLAQLTAEKRRGVAAENEAQARQLEIQNAEDETRVQLEAAKQLRLEAFTAAQEAHHLKTESSEAAHVLSECKAALERHDAEEERDGRLAEENAELEAALKVEAAIVEELRDLCTSESKCYTVAMSECDSLRRELHDLTRLVPQEAAGYPRSRASVAETNGTPRKSTARK